MIKRPIRIVLCAAYLFCASACAADCVPLKASNISDVNAEIGDLRDQAHIEYSFGQPEKSVGFLAKLIDVYARTQCTTVVPEVMRPSFQYEEMVERARLARMHQKLGNAAKANAETEKAVSLGRRVFQKPQWTAAELGTLIEQLDAKVRDLVRAGMDQREKDKSGLR